MKTEFLMIQLNTACNFDCEYCYIPTEQRQVTNLISIETIDKIFERLFNSTHCGEVVQVLFHAGEPLTTPITYFEKILQHILKQKKMFSPDTQLLFTMMSNGSLVNIEWIRFFKEYGITPGISIDGPEWLHNSKRKTMGKKDSFEQVMRGIKLLQENDLPVSVLSVVHQETLNYPEELVDFYFQHQFKTVGLLTEEIVGGQDKSSLYTSENQTKLKVFFKRFWNRIQEHDNQAIRFREFYLPFIGLTSQKELGSGIVNPLDFIHVNYAGDFTTFDPNFVHTKNTIYGEDLFFGNVHTHNFVDILATKKFQHVYEDLQAGYQQCEATYDYFKACPNIYNGNKILEHGTLNSTETIACRQRVKFCTDVLVNSLEETLQLQTTP